MAENILSHPRLGSTTKSEIRRSGFRRLSEDLVHQSTVQYFIHFDEFNKRTKYDQNIFTTSHLTNSLSVRMGVNVYSFCRHISPSIYIHQGGPRRGEGAIGYGSWNLGWQSRRGEGDSKQARSS